MRIYNAGMTLRALTEFGARHPYYKPNVLLSYPLLPNNFRSFTHRDRHLIGSLILDNGAFSANSPNSKLSPEELYLQFKTFCKYNSTPWDLIFSFDRMFGLNGYETNLQYQIEFEQMGIPVVPVVHNIYNDEVDKILDRGLPPHKVVAIGQCDGRQVYKNIETPVMKLYNAGAKIHFFGAILYNLFSKLPLWSCDATSWTKYPSMGLVLYWNPQKKNFNKTDKLHFPKYQDGKVPSGGVYYKTYDYIKDFEEYIATNLGFELNDLLGGEADDNRSIANILYYSQLEKEITAKQKALGFEFSD